MRNIPFPFLSEETLESVARQQQETGRTRNTGIVRIDPTEIDQYWSEIQNHKWFLSERLGRDVGTGVAALDYFENIRQLAPVPSRSFVGRLKTGVRNALSTLEGAFEYDGPTSIVNLERMMRSARPYKL
ncbi:MAG: DUF4032 domain-containing protein [Acidobacteriaceae bacterium]|nr:DUF4032 domain-containing protein [Acidobacteriaceae bacterium]